ncbi:heat-inducible transcription repressor HrcA [Quadrisphaera granulorum]|uniref:Heat-inducible transcription repressor HrcA n=1 Tax=Quadrisphaera granulorum TaxID=317664 RepID=A0A316A863_9ACTN|nr:heat-inducible transcriptional repressor HrcA [Quadrisphaera granulorum]PWJ54031.1 heat-inducible transcription repressor HrcA [Quadrisphaera granulorum]SZE96488.1 heat-inducible transcription repressor HrcA [Quadrisphaera granulorum]
MTEPRRLAVLRAIVEDYVATQEPVGSKALVERHALGVSPATIRNDMAALEEEGLIAQPHTSAGRIPTDKGYRAFVDGLPAVRPLSPAERRAIDRLLGNGEPVDLDEVLERTVRALAQLTHQVAVIQYPSLARARVRHVELVQLAPRRLVLVLITDSGRVEQRSVEIPPDAPEVVADLVTELRGRLNAATASRRSDEAVAALDGVVATWSAARPEDSAAASVVAAALRSALDATREERMVLAGTANLVRGAGGFSASVAPVLEAIEEQVVVLRLLAEMADDPASGVSVRIGREIVHSGLSDAAVVASGYGSGGEVVARLGILGPTRMDYPTSIAAVRAVARYLSKVLAP